MKNLLRSKSISVCKMLRIFLSKIVYFTRLYPLAKAENLQENVYQKVDLGGIVSAVCTGGFCGTDGGTGRGLDVVGCYAVCSTAAYP